jgi:hypothetical protein
VTLGHAGALEEIHRILSLRQKEAIRRACDRNPEEVMEIPEIGHGEFGVE